MGDPFAKLERPSLSTVLRVIGLFVLVAYALAYGWIGNEAVPVTGVVQSVGPSSFGKYQGGTQQAASVRLADGSLVQAYVISGGLVSAGERVQMYKEARLFGAMTTYQIVAKNPPDGNRDQPN